MARDTIRWKKRGASPVIGLVLMVAIVVVLATAIGGFLYQFGDQDRQPTPQIAITTDYDDAMDTDGHSLSIEFKSGDTLETATVKLQLDGAMTAGGSAVSLKPDQLVSQTGSEVTAGESVVIDRSTTTSDSPEQLDLSEATLRLVWNPSDPEVKHTEILWEWSA